MNVYLVSIKRKSWCQNYAMVVVAEDKILEKYGIFRFVEKKKGLVVIIAIVLKVSGIGRLLGMGNMIKITINFRG